MDALKALITTRLPAAVSRLLDGAFLAVVLGQALTVWISTCGTSPAATLALFTVACLSVAALPTLKRFVGRDRSLWPALVGTTVICGLSFALPQMTNRLVTLVATLMVEEGPLSGLPEFLLTAAFCAVLPLLTVLVSAQGGSNRSPTAYLTGMATGFALLLVHAVWTIPLTVTVAILAVLSIATRMIFEDTRSNGEKDWELSHAGRTEAVGHAGTGRADVPAAPRLARLGLRDWASAGRGVSGIATGLLLLAVWKLVTLLIPGHANLVVVAAAEFCLLLAVSSLRFVRRLVSPWRLAAFSFLALCGLPLLFPQLMELNFRLTAYTDSVWLLMVARSAQLALLSWLAVTLSAAKASTRDEEPHFLSSPMRVSWILCGVCMGLVASVAGLSAKGTFGVGLASAGLSLLLPLLADFRTNGSIRRFLYPAAAAAGATVAIVTPIDSATPARLLFSSRSYQSLRSGLDCDLIPVAAGVRLHQQAQTGTGTLTVWRLSGDLVELRRNGIPLGTVSTNTFTTPQPVADIAAGILGLTMHPGPGSVLVLGDDTGLNLRTCCNFPLHTIRAVREDSALTKFAEKNVWATLRTSPASDDRVTSEQQPLSLALRRPSDVRFDVIIAPTANPFRTDCMAQLTEEYYCAAADRLSAGGIFSQRFQLHDLGAEPLVALLSTASEVFDRVAAVYVVPGEIVLLATNSQTPLLDAGFLNRLQKEHVRRELGRSGWDWAQLAALPIIDAQDPIGLFDHEERRPAITSGNGRFVFGLPVDAERWGDKSGELASMFAPHQMRIAEATPHGPAHEEFRRRISSVAQQSEILANFPDQPWPYRISLKMEMQRNPRPPVETIRDGEVRRQPHPLDEYRKDYFLALGGALKAASENDDLAVATARLERFTLKYEPLISHFAHHELVRLHEMTGCPRPSEELRHRLHTVFYHEPGDYSVRHVAAAIDRLTDSGNEDLTADESFDHLNALLQALVQRWQARTQYEPTSAQVIQNDIDECVRAANRALDEMEQLSEVVGFSRRDFLSRRRYINDALIGPLRNYRQNILAHRMNDHVPDAADGTMNAATNGPDDLPLLMDPGELLTN